MDEHEVTRLFLRGIWASSIPDDEDVAWLDRVATRPADDGPLGDYGPLVRRMQSAGINDVDIARFARAVAYETAFGFCYHLVDPNASFEGFDENPEDVAWGLFKVDGETGDPVRPIVGLHEEILGMDPSGNEMRPRS